MIYKAVFDIDENPWKRLDLLVEVEFLKAFWNIDILDESASECEVLLCYFRDE